MRNVKRVLVVGAGAGGAGIAHLCAQAGLDTALVDATDESGADLEAATERADLVIEAITEDLDAKQSLLQRLDTLCPPDVVLATGTGQYQVSRVAQRCVHRDRVVGIHWSNAPLSTSLVEIVPAGQSAPAVIEAVKEFVRACGRQFVVVRKDVPGFISNRLRMAMFMEAIRLVDEGVATVQDVDRVARGMYRHPTGPLETLDLVGLDNAAAAAASMAAYYEDDRFAAAPLLAAMVARGETGSASGKGFYEHTVRG
ncbi:3-hydroxyacyl-CoA dehydrogenase family protein [Dactylosporangium sp. CA-092794]|uniref:3-hydroxyacyl-CoA dehydrogenase family protein n=1 Tax=Dactylosporangium sp. CA-092794 TaxID=3239929 RepID=UPI003D922C48